MIESGKQRFKSHFSSGHLKLTFKSFKLEKTCQKDAPCIFMIRGCSHITSSLTRGVGVREKMMKDDGHIWGGWGRVKDDDFLQK